MVNQGKFYNKSCTNPDSSKLDEQEALPLLWNSNLSNNTSNSESEICNWYEEECLSISPEQVRIGDFTTARKSSNILFAY